MVRRRDPGEVRWSRPWASGTLRCRGRTGPSHSACSLCIDGLFSCRGADAGGQRGTEGPLSTPNCRCRADRLLRHFRGARTLHRVQNGGPRGPRQAHGEEDSGHRWQCRRPRGRGGQGERPARLVLGRPRAQRRRDPREPHDPRSDPRRGPDHLLRRSCRAARRARRGHELARGHHGPGRCAPGLRTARRSRPEPWLSEAERMSTIRLSCGLRASCGPKRARPWPTHRSAKSWPIGSFNPRA